MNPPKIQQSLADALRTAAASYQEAQVIPHCSVCANPCCRLDQLVLELNWRQVKVFWRLEESRGAFDKRLSAGQGPAEIRAGNGLYYAHRKACPAYDEAGHGCRVYDQAIKPAGCSDFPVYEDGDCVTADLRCEAVDLDGLTAWMAQAVGPEYRIVQTPDRDFPFMVALSVKRTGGKAKPGPRRGRPA